MSTINEPAPEALAGAAPAGRLPAAGDEARLRLPSVSHLGFALAAVGLIFALAVPEFASRSRVFFWNEVLVYVLFATSVNLLVGQTGLLSFGQAAYFGAGAYGLALMLQHHNGEALSLLVAALAALGLALAVGVLILRATGIAFAMLTLAFAQMAYTLVFKVHSLGGENGLSGITRKQFLGIGIKSPTHYYFFTLVVVTLCIALIWWFVNSPFGLTLRVIREDAGRAEFLGLRVRLYQLVAFGLAGLFAGVGGALFAMLHVFVDPSALYWTKSADPIVMTILGGAGTFLGPALGAVVYQWFTQWLQHQTQAWVLYTGLLFIGLILVAPGGILGLLVSFRAMVAGEQPWFWRRWQRGVLQLARRGAPRVGS